MAVNLKYYNEEIIVPKKVLKNIDKNAKRYIATFFKIRICNIIDYKNFIIEFVSYPRRYINFIINYVNNSGSIHYFDNLPWFWVDILKAMVILKPRYNVQISYIFFHKFHKYIPDYIRYAFALCSKQDIFTMTLDEVLKAGKNTKIKLNTIIKNIEVYKVAMVVYDLLEEVLTDYDETFQKHMDRLLKYVILPRCEWSRLYELQYYFDMVENEINRRIELIIKIQRRWKNIYYDPDRKLFTQNKNLLKRWNN